MTTLNCEKIYLIEHDDAQILSDKLPSNLQMLRVFFHNHRTINLTVRESAKLAIEEAIVFWRKARIPTRKDYHCIDKLQKLYQKWQGLSKNSQRKSPTHQRNVQEFVEIFDDIFDIAHTDAMSLMKNEASKEFLTSQRSKGRPGCLPVLDDETLAKEQRKLERLKKEENRKQLLLAKSKQREESGRLCNFNQID